MDNGCATGSNSVFILSQLTKNLVDEHNPNLNLKAILNDIPDNDWTVLNETMQSKMSAEIGKGTFSFQPVPKTMYGGLLADKEDRIHLVYSSTALHWISASPVVPLSDPHLIFPQHDPDEWVRKAWAGQAAADWDLYLQERGKETAWGGFLVALLLNGVNDFEEVLHATKKRLIVDGTIASDEALRMQIPIYARSIEEILAGFEKGECGSLVWKDVWEKVTIKGSEISCPFTAEFKDNLISNVERVNGVIGFCRACMEPSLLQAFSDPKHAQDVLEKYWSVATQLALERPVEAFETKYKYSIVVLRRVSNKV